MQYLPYLHVYWLLFLSPWLFSCLSVDLWGRAATMHCSQSKLPSDSLIWCDAFFPPKCVLLSSILVIAVCVKFSGAVSLGASWQACSNNVAIGSQQVVTRICQEILKAQAFCVEFLQKLNVLVRVVVQWRNAASLADGVLLCWWSWFGSNKYLSCPTVAKAFVSSVGLCDWFCTLHQGQSGAVLF